jgi:hypothetical protein
MLDKVKKALQRYGYQLAVRGMTVAIPPASTFGYKLSV